MGPCRCQQACPTEATPPVRNQRGGWEPGRVPRGRAEASGPWAPPESFQQTRDSLRHHPRETRVLGVEALRSAQIPETCRRFWLLRHGRWL